MSDKPELAKCPFCGGEAEIVYTNTASHSYAAVSCKKCGCEVGNKDNIVKLGESFHTADVKAAALWNTRFQEPYEVHTVLTNVEQPEFKVNTRIAGDGNQIVMMVGFLIEHITKRTNIPAVQFIISVTKFIDAIHAQKAKGGIITK